MKTITKLDPRLIVEQVEDILDLPVVIRVNDFDEEDVEDFEEAMSDAHQTGQDIIPIVIDSYGGSVYGLLSMMSAIDNAELPVATILTGKAMSAGAILFGYGDEGYRFMDPHAWIMFHDISTEFDHIRLKVEELKIDAKHLEDLNKNLYTRLAHHLGHPSNYFLDLIANLDLYFNAKEALKHRVANHLRIPTLEIEVTVSSKLR